MRPLDPRLAPLLRPAAPALGGVVVAQVAAGALLVAQAFTLGALVTALLGRLDASAATEVPMDLVTPAAWFAGVTVLRAVATWAGARAAAAASATVTTSLRRRLLTEAVAHGTGPLDQRRRGEVTLLATRGLAALDPYLTRYLPSLVVAAVLPPLVLLALLTQDLLSFVVVALTLPLVPVFAILVGTATRDRAEQQWRLLSRLSGHFVDVVTGLRTLVTFGRAEAQADTIRAVTQRYRDASRATLRLGFASSVTLELVATLSVALVAVTVGLRLAADGLPLVTAMTVLLLAPEAYWPLRRVGAEFHAAAEGTATLERVQEVLAERAGAPGPDREHDRGHRLAAPGAERVVAAGAGILLADVTLAHPGRDDAALAGFTAVVPGRGLTAVTGPSGSGKSTLLAAIVGDLQPRAGRILVGQVPLSAVRGSWRRQVAWVSQRPWLAPGTVADNVRLGRPDASDADVEDALRRVGLGVGPGVERDDRIAEDGAGLSAGQRARVALARAVVSQRRWVVLDEPTAHLDADTEDRVLRVLRELAEEGRAVVVVAHRPAVVDAADHVIDVPAPPVPAARVAVTSALPTALLGVPSGPAEGTTTRAQADPAPGSAGPTNGAGNRPANRLVDRLGDRLGRGLATGLGVLSAASGVALTATAGWLVARSAEHPPVLVLMVAIVGVRLFGLARPVLRYAERLLSHDLALTELAERRARVFEAVVPLVPGALGPARGDLLTSLVDDVDAGVDRALRVRQPVVTGTLVGLTAAVLAATQHAGVAAILLTLTGAALLASALVRRAVGRATAEVVGARADLSRRVEQLLAGATDLRLWQLEDRAVTAVGQVGDHSARAARRTARVVGAAQAVLLTAAGAGVLATAALMASATTAGVVSGPMAVLLVLTPLALAEVLIPLADAGATAAHVDAAERRVAELVGRQPRVQEQPGCLPVDLGRPRLRLESVVPGWDGPACAPVDLDLGPGGRVGLVGPSGSGKSTLAETLARGLDPVAGRVLLTHEERGAMAPGGASPAWDVCHVHDLRDLPLRQVRSTVGVLGDDPHVFGSTLRENLRLARPTASDAEIESALGSVALATWYAALPHGLDTWLGDGGLGVSGGERARLGLARLVLSGHPVWVLDEPTAHLDGPLARRLAEVVLSREGAGAQRSVVWITHTTAGLDLVDEVVVLHPSVGAAVDLSPATSSA